MNANRPDPCADWRTRLSAAHDGEPAGGPDLDRHLTGCPRCRAFAAGLAPLSAGLGALRSEDVPAGSWDALAARLAATRPARPASRVHLLRAAALLLGFASVHAVARWQAAGRPPASVDDHLALPSPWNGALPERVLSERLGAVLEDPR